jgi:ribose 5-phosphate isomerase B
LAGPRRAIPYIQEPMRIAAGFDHAGYPLRETILTALEGAGHEVVDCGTDSEESVDYPVHAALAAQLVSAGEADLAVLACGSGTGVSIVANKLPRVRAVNARDPEDAEMGRRHNDANVLALAGRKVGEGEARAIVAAFLGAEFEGGRHQRRLDQIARVESGELPIPPARAAKEAT